MLTSQFLFVNINFVISLVAALVLFSIFWLHFDAWLNQKTFTASLPFLGFLLLSLSFIVAAVTIEQSLLQKSILENIGLTPILVFLRLAGYGVLIVGQVITPLQPLPNYRQDTKAVFPFAAGLPQLSFFLFPVLAAMTGVLYLRRATTGLEHHLKPIALGFFVLACSELFNLAVFFRNSDNIAIVELTNPFGPLWLVQRGILLIAIFILGRWAWSYLLKRFESQLFIIFTTVTLIIFLSTAISFTFATLDNVKQGLLVTLQTDVAVLGYTIESKKSEVLADAVTIAQDPRVSEALAGSDRKALADITVPILIAKKATEIVVVGSNGEIVLRAEDAEAQGGSMSDNPLVRSAIQGTQVVSITTREGALSPIVSVRAAAPIAGGGVVLFGSDIDDAFVDGIKKATGLDASIYADNVRSATTFVAEDGISRYNGIKENSEQVLKSVLKDSGTYSGTVSILNVPYFSAFAPLTNSDDIPVGMVFVGRPEVSILKTASRSIEFTFMTTAILLAISTVASYFVSKYIVSQIR